MSFEPTPETVSARDIRGDYGHQIVNYPTESTLDSAWTEEGVLVPDEEDGTNTGATETNEYSRYLINGTLAQRILKKAGKVEGRVTVTEATIPYWLSEVTADTDFTFTVQVDGETVWDSETQSVYIDSDWRKPEGSFTLTNLGVLNDWLNS